MLVFLVMLPGDSVVLEVQDAMCHLFCETPVLCHTFVVSVMHFAASRPCRPTAVEVCLADNDCVSVQWLMMFCCCTTAVLQRGFAVFGNLGMHAPAAVTLQV
jgi:hypothetical protein